MSLISKASYDISRTTEGSFSAGVYIPGATSTFTIKGNIQPLSGAEILQLPEADRKRQSMWLYTKEELLENDIITVNGKPYEIHPVEDWTRQGRLQHYKSRIMLKDI